MTQSLFSLAQKSVIITGGAGHLGAAISRELALAGADVYALGRNAAKLKVLEDFNQTLPCKRIHTLELDVTDEAAFQDLVQRVYEQHGEISCLINNANDARREAWEDLDTNAWRKGIDGALTHYFSCSHAVSPYMLKKGKGVIIHNASLFAFLAPCFPMHLDLKNAAAAHHAAAKGGVLQLTRYLATLWGPHGIRVNCVSPGYFPQKRGPDRPDYMKEVTARIPMSRIGDPKEVSGAFVFLASEAASYITGHNLVVDGGYSVW